RRVEHDEVGPRLLQAEADAARIRRLDRGDPFLEGLVRGAAIALERELDVLGGDRVAVVELHAAAQDELVREPVGRYGPRLGERRGQRVPGSAFSIASWSP